MRAFALIFFLLATASAQTTSAQKTSQEPPRTAPKNGFIFWSTPRKSVDFLLDPVPQADSVRLAQLKQTFSDFQCLAPNLREQPTPRGNNLLCTLPATAPQPEVVSDRPRKGAVAADPSGTILFLAHYEHEGPGQSAIDDWTGALMLTFLFHALSATPHHHTYLFAAVDGEPGAKALFESFTAEQRRDIKGVVALDALGLGAAQFYIDPNDLFATWYGSWFLNAQLVQAAADQRLPAPLRAIPGGWFKIDDTREFRYHSIPSILIHSVDFHSRDLPGTAGDKASAINRDAYYNTFVLLAYYAAELDRPWPSPAATASSRPSGGRRR